MSELKQLLMRNLLEELKSKKFSARLDSAMRDVQGEVYHAILPAGSVDAKIMFVGESPGRSSKGIVNQDREKSFGMGSGVLLDEMLAYIGLSRENVWVTNVIKTNMPEDIQNNPWTKEEIKENEGFLKREVEIVRPRIIVTLGKFSSDYFLKARFNDYVFGKNYKIFIMSPSFFKCTIIPVFHPAYIQRRPTLLEEYKKHWDLIRRALNE